MRYAFIASHRDQFDVRAMCRCLALQPSGFYAWAKSTLSQRAREDVRQTGLIRQAWNEYQGADWQQAPPPGSPRPSSVAANTPDRQFDVEEADRTW